MEIEKFIQLFSEHLKCSFIAASSCKMYIEEIMMFRAYLYEINAVDITVESVKGYILKMIDRNLKNSTLSRKVMIVKIFLKFLYNEEHISLDIAKSIKTPKKQVVYANFLSSETACKLCEIPDQKTYKGIRDRAILELFFSSGIRLSELTKLRKQDIYYNEKIIKIFGKGSKERFVPITEKAVNCMQAYDKIRNKSFEVFFLSYDKKQFTIYGIGKIVKYYLSELGFDKGYSAHTLRHTCATHLLMNNCSLNVIQKILGHENISTTERYVHITLNDVKSAFAVSHVRNRV